MNTLSTDDNDADGPSGSRPRRPGYVSTACRHCQKARRKCDGEYPCQACVARKLQCTFDESKDGRRGRKRTLDQLQSKADALETLLTSLKSSDDDSIRDLILLVRNEVPLEEIMQHTKTIVRQNEDRDRFRARIRRTVLDVSTLIDEPPIRVPAKPWTTVTDDDHAVSHLISVYFTWQHYGYPCMDQEVFVREMNSKNLSSQFCSPFLVNSMLAVACVYTDHPSAFANPDDPSSRGLHFLDEAAKLWPSMQENVTLSVLQALPSIGTITAALAQDRATFLYINQSFALTTELVRLVKKSQNRGASEFTSAEFRRSYTLAQWGLFCIQAEIAIAWSKPYDLRAPSRKDPYTAEELQLTRAWSPYPQSSSEIPCHSNMLITQTYRLYETAAELSHLVLSGSPQDSPLPGYIILDRGTKLERLHEIRGRLLEWYHNLPHQAQIGDMDNSVPTEPLTNLHLSFNSFRISTANQVLRIPGIEQDIKDRAAEDVIDASRNIARIYEWRQRTTGLFYCGIYTSHAASLSAYGLLDYLPSRSDVRDPFHTAVVALSTSSHRWFMSRGVVKMLWIELERRKLTSLVKPETLALLKLGAVDSWSPEDHELLKRCAYPNYAVMRERGSSVLAEMGDLIDEYTRLSVTETEYDVDEHEHEREHNQEREQGDSLDGPS